MTSGPPPEPNRAAPGATPPSPNIDYPGPPPYPHPQQPWTGPGRRGGPPPATKGSGPAVAAVILGLLGCVVPLLPIDLTGVRAYSAFPFALPGLALAVVGLAGRHRGRPLAAVGATLSALALLIGAAMIAGQVLG